jgi:hypothetical protein
MKKDIITKEFIIEYLKTYYKINNKIPLLIDKTHPFSQKTVYNKLGSWTNALTEACIPLRINKPLEVECNECKKYFTKHVNQIKKTNKNFCSQSCSAIFYNKIIDRTMSEENKQKVKEKLQKSHKCNICDNMIIGGNRKTCSDICLKEA